MGSDCAPRSGQANRRRQQSYIDSIQAWQAECDQFEPVEDGDITLEELESEELPWEEPIEQTESATRVSLAPLLLLLCQLVFVLLALPVVLVGGILQATVFGIDKLADWLASPKPGHWGNIQAMILAVP